MSEAFEKQLMGNAAELAPYFQDELVTDILINGPGNLFIEKMGKMHQVVSPFQSTQSLFDWVERILYPIGKRIDALQPYADGKLLDGSRFNVILPPIALDGPIISIRKARKKEKISLAEFGNIEEIEFLRSAVKSKKNLLVAGGTGTGKTTILSRLLEEVDPNERMVIIEETHEVVISHPHAVYLEARQSNAEGVGGVSLRNLVKNALRMRPDRIILGECRGEEAFDMVQAMSTGHQGSMGTLHANSALDALKRIESLVLLTGFSLTMRAVREWVSSCVDGVVYLEKTSCGERKIKEIISIRGLEGEVYRIQPFAFT